MKPNVLILLGFALLSPTYILLLRQSPLGGAIKQTINFSPVWDLTELDNSFLAFQTKSLKNFFGFELTFR